MNFKKLTVWKRSKDLTVFVYKITTENGFDRDPGLKDQIRRAAVSIPSNIAEGDELNTDKQSVKYFYYSKASSAEVLTQAIIAHEIGYIDSKVLQYIENECTAISSMLYKLIRSRSG